MEEYEDFLIDEDDEIFFGMPEDVEVDMSGIDYIFEDEEEQHAAFSDVAGAASTSSKSKSSKSHPKRGKSSSSSSVKKKKPNEPRLPCPHCDKTYANQGTLQNHLNSMVIKDLVKRAPNYETLLTEMPDLCVEALQEMKGDLSVGELASECASLLEAL